jgi:Fur family transcriptional regulator, peroxide stress response regulator
LVREVINDVKSARFDAALHPHHHFICDLCGAIEDIAWFDVRTPDGILALEDKSVRWYEVVFHGVCRACIGNASGREVRV